MNDDKFQKIYEDACTAGHAAGMACTPAPMRVRYRGHDGDDRVEVVDDGPCGFAWVRIPGTTAFARWAKKNRLVSPGYPRGLDFWISDHNQSVARKAAHARAFAAVLVAAGIEARADSRLD